jgi:hypothetical protein
VIAVRRSFTHFCGKDVNLAAIDEIAAPCLLFKYARHEPHRVRGDIRIFMADFRAAFLDFNFWRTADLLAERDYVGANGKVAAPIRVLRSRMLGSYRSRLAVHIWGRPARQKNQKDI